MKLCGHYKKPLLLSFALTVNTHAWSAYSNKDVAGDSLQILLPLTAYSISLYKNDNTGLLEFSKSAALTIGTVQTFKYSFNQKRPNGSDHSFPSGHTAISFASAEFMRKRYGLYAGVPSYILASYVGYTRVEVRDHYILDIMAGAALGFASSNFFTEPYPGVIIKAEVDNRYLGVNINIGW